jgi:hypothetical protein
MTYLDWYIGSSISLAIPRTWSQNFALIKLSQTHNFSFWSSSLWSTSVCISWALSLITSLPNHLHSCQLHTMLLQFKDVCAHVPLDFFDWNPKNIDLKVITPLMPSIWFAACTHHNVKHRIKWKNMGALRYGNLGTTIGMNTFWWQSVYPTLCYSSHALITGLWKN